MITSPDILLLLTIPFACGLAGGLRARKPCTSILAGFGAGAFAIGLVVFLGSRGSWSIAFHWESWMSLFLLSALWGSLTGYLLIFLSGTTRPVERRTSLAIVAVAVLFQLLLWAPGGARPKTRRANCFSNLKQIGLTLEMYGESYEGRLPPENGAKGLDYLLRENIFAGTNGPQRFLCAEDKSRRAAQPGAPLMEDNCSYVYVPTVWWNGTDTNVLPVCWDKPGNHGTIGLNVLFNDGHVEFVTLERWETIKPKQ